jgi:hypothetical protein
MSKDSTINVLMQNLGFFKGIEILLRDRTITTDEASRLRAYSFSLLGNKVAEIKREIVQLQSVVDLLESICRQGAVRKPSGTAGDEVSRMREAVKRFHGWTISLAESDFHLLYYVEDSSVAGTKFHNLSGQLNKLQLERRAAKNSFSGMGHIPL